MQVLVTRPQPQADRWTERLRSVGIAASPLPLIAIADAPDPAAVAAAWAGLPQRRLAVFVSPNAVAKFFDHRPVGMAWPEATHAASIGPGTTEALAQHGVPADRIVEPAADSTQFDSEALWQRLGVASRDWHGASVLMVRGNGGRDWLADRLRERGAHVDAVAAYARVAPRFEGDVLKTLNVALAAPAEHVWLLSSSEAVDHLQRAVPHATWQAARGIATHPRIAERAEALGFGRVHACAAGFDAVRACLQSFTS